MGLYLLPYAEVNTLLVFTYHPSQIHVDAFAGTLSLWCRYMFTGTLRMVYRKEVVVKMYQCLFCRFVLIGFAGYKGILQRCVLAVVPLQKMNEVQHIGSIKGTVYKAEERFQVGVLMVQDKVIRCVAHQLHQPIATVNDTGTVAPSQHSCKQSAYFYILL